MFEVKITLDITPALENALNRITDALGGVCLPAPAVAIDGKSIGQAESIAQAPAAQPAPVPAVPAAQTPAPVPAVPVAQPALVPAVPVAQTPAPVPVAQPTAAPAVPVAQTVAPTYTKEQVAAAGAALIQARPETRDALIGLLTQFGVNAINNLPDAQLGAFATALRQLGANI